MLKRFVLVFAILSVLMGAVSLDSPAYPAMDSCSAAMIGLAFYHAAHESCVSAGSQPCLHTFTAMLTALALVDELCEFNQ